MPEIVGSVLSALALGLELVGAAVIVITGIGALRMFAAPLRRRPVDWHHGRQSFGRGLIVGLEYLIGADVLKTIVAPEVRELAVLGVVILLRTVLSLSIEFELRQAQERRASGSP